MVKGIAKKVIKTTIKSGVTATAIVLHNPVLCSAKSLYGYGAFAGEGAIILDIIIIAFLVGILGTLLSSLGQEGAARMLGVVGAGVITVKVLRLATQIVSSIRTFVGA